MLHLIAKVYVYILFSILLSYIPVNRSFISDKNGIEIFIVSNGIHTDIVLPIQSEILNWSTIFQFNDFRAYWRNAEYIAFGWGDLGFYLNTPEWKDLKFQTAFIAFFTPSESAMHVTLTSKPQEGKLCYKVIVSEEVYISLVKYIKSSFKIGDDNLTIKINHQGYGKFDLFYESDKKFYLFKTCNSWTNKGLKVAGIRTALWTPFDKPILFHLSRIKK